MLFFSLNPGSNDAPLATDQITSPYCYLLISEDRPDYLLSLQKSRDHGDSVLSIVLDKPGCQVSAHITIFVSAAGRDPEFIE